MILFHVDNVDLIFGLTISFTTYNILIADSISLYRLTLTLSVLLIEIKQINA